MTDDGNKKVLTLIGSLRSQSSSLQLAQEMESLATGVFEMRYYDGLQRLRHFNPDLDNDDLPGEVAAFRREIEAADSVLICTPEYIFSLPGCLKNALELCVATTLFSNKPVALVTAAASGEQAHEELKLVMKTLGAKFTADTLLLIKGTKAKFTSDTGFDEPQIMLNLIQVIFAFGRQFDR